MSAHPWQVAMDQFNTETLPVLTRLGLKIGTDKGEDAQRIQRFYGMLHRSFDPLTYEMLRSALATWMAQQGKEVT